MIRTDEALSRIRRLPTLSATTARLGTLLENRTSGAADFERVIRPDPALTANLLRLANSAYFGLRSRVESVRQAIAYLGLKRVFEVAASAAFAPLIPRRLPGYDVDAEAFWTHCAAVAVLSERLAAELHLAAPDLVFTAGLLHDAGKIAACIYVADEQEEILERVRAGRPFVLAEKEVLGVTHAELGGMLAEAWNLPPAAAWAARWHHRPARCPPEVDRRLVALVHAADALAHQLGFGADAGELAREIDPEAEGLLGLKTRRLEAVAGASLEFIREMGGLFRADPGGKA